MAIPDKDHAQVYNAFYKELGVNNITEALQATYGGKYFARKFKKSKAFEDYKKGLLTAETPSLTAFLEDAPETESVVKKYRSNYLAAPQLLIEKIKKSKYRQKEVAEMVGVSVDSISNYLHKKSKMPPEVLKKLQEIFEVKN